MRHLRESRLVGCVRPKLTRHLKSDRQIFAFWKVLEELPSFNKLQIGFSFFRNVFKLVVLPEQPRTVHDEERGTLLGTAAPIDGLMITHAHGEATFELGGAVTNILPDREFRIAGRPHCFDHASVVKVS